MLQKDDWNGLAKRLLLNIETGTRELCEDTYEMPVSHYSDDQRWKREIDLIFRQIPLILAFSCELAESNSYRAMCRIGIPLLLTRGKDGKVRGFINACRHRGAHLTGEAEKCGVAGKFVCPYHAWTYDNAGRLVGVPASSQFGTIPDEYRHLIPIPVEEHAGFIWGTLTPGTKMDLRSHLGDMLPLIEQVGAQKFYFAGTRTLDGPNWKIALDGYIENYHFNVLHKDTFGTLLSDDHTVYDVVGAHTRYLVPSPTIHTLRNIPEAQWNASNSLMLAFSVFPNVSMGFDLKQNSRDQVFTMAQVWPGEHSGSSITHLSYATQRPWRSDEIDDYMDLSIDIIKREDYWIGAAIQNSLAAMSDQKFIYGRMERMVQHFEKSVNALVDKPECLLAV